VTAAAVAAEPGEAPRRVLVTGGSGFIGTNLVQHYTSLGCEVLNIDCVPPRNPQQASVWRALDILEPEALQELTHAFQPDFIFHMAARTDLDGNGIADYRANTQGVSNMIEAARGVRSLRGIVFASSMLVCELGYRPKDELDVRPTTAYGHSKAQGESIVRSEAGDSMPWVIARPTSIWGPWFDVPYRNFFNAVAAGWYWHPRGARVRRSYGFVYNAVFILDRLARACAGGGGHRTYYVADYEPVELRRWAEAIRLALDAPRVREVPLPILGALARAGDLLKLVGYRHPPLSSFRLRNLLTEAVYDLEPTRAVCGALPYATEEAIAITADWMRAH
jgi:nucleoside-diphosphate-sugar epimerase